MVERMRDLWLRNRSTLRWIDSCIWFDRAVQIDDKSVEKRVCSDGNRHFSILDGHHPYPDCRELDLQNCSLLRLRVVLIISC